jgi:hypothetical protein
MLKYLLLITIFSCANEKLLAQKDCVSLNVFTTKIDSVEDPNLNLEINFISNCKEMINIISQSSISSFLCGISGPIGIRFEKLVDSCFQDWGSDCNSPFPSRPKTFKELMSGESIIYKFDIGKILDKKKLENKGIKFKGVYRFKIFHRYMLNNNEKVVSSDWVYLTF